MLYLDKCWNELQVLLGPDEGQPPRPAFRLVEGSVTHTDDGWIAFERALSPEEVQAIADDLLTVTEKDIAKMVDRYERRIHPRDEELAYVSQYLADAQLFMKKLAPQGRGLVYLIG